MLNWLWRLVVVGFPSRPGLNALRQRVETVERMLELFMDEVKQQRGRIATALRTRKVAGNGDAEAPQSPQDAPGPTIEGTGYYTKPLAARGGPKGRGNY